MNQRRIAKVQRDLQIAVQQTKEETGMEVDEFYSDLVASMCWDLPLEEAHEMCRRELGWIPPEVMSRGESAVSRSMEEV
jgi:hypothetical protein